MSTHLDHFRPQDTTGSQHYLEATIRTASPARMRLMLIERAVEVSGTLAGLWRDKKSLGSNEQSLKLLDLLNELLSGVTGGPNEGETRLCLKVADLYVFLIQHLVAAEEISDSLSIDDIRIVLETEADTWRAVCLNEVSALPANRQSAMSTESASAGLNFEA